MPTWDEILRELENANPIIVLQRYVHELSQQTKRTTICYMSACTVVRKGRVPAQYHTIIDQDMEGFMTCSKGVDKEGLDLILHTPGGDSEATKRLINYLHEIYTHIRVFVPHIALSGGTLLACAANEVYMGPYSSLGPTDPQIFLNNQMIPVKAIINEFRMAFNDVTKDTISAVLWHDRLRQIPFGLIKTAETMLINGQKYLRELLKKRHWPQKSDDERDEIARFFNSHEQYSSHGEGIDMRTAQNYLNVHDLRQNKQIEDLVLSIYHSAMIMFERTIAQKIVFNNLGRRYIMNYEPK